MAAQESHPFHWHYAELDDKNFKVHGRSLLLAVILFSLLLFFTLFCLYARWVCRYRQRSSAAAAAISSSTTHPAVPQVLSVGLDPATIEGLPIFLHSSSATAGDEVQCSICISAFQDEEKVKVLPQCHHAFHPECVDKWLSTQSSCPLCRASLRVDSIPDSAVP